MGAATMGRKKSKQGPKGMGLNMKASPEWSDWLRRAAEHSGMPISVFMDQAARLMAKKQGFDEPPPKR
jgi:uncharacterized protein (DUF1778 family)